MSGEKFAPQLDVESSLDEGGLRAPPHLKGWRKAWWWFDFIILVKLARLRFIAVLVAIGAVITQWGTLTAYYDKWTRPESNAVSVGGDVEWFCPMHPSIVRDNAKEKCPICFMPLSKRKKGDVKEEVLPAGVVNRVQLAPYRVALAGVNTWSVDYLPLKKEISAVGFVEFNERGQRKVTARTKGRIDQLFVNETGAMVETGDLLASLYSPELNVTMQNLLDAQRNGNRELLESSRTRLRLLGVDDEQADEVLRSGQANTHVKIRSPIGGHVIKKYVQEGQYVDEGMLLYEVADLSTVWIQAQIYEDDMSLLPTNQAHKSTLTAAPAPKVTAVTRAFPNEPFEGVLTFIYPHVDQDTRTVTVRCEVDNPGHKLRPGGTATVHLQVDAAQLDEIVAAASNDDERRSKLSQGLTLAVPESSIIDTGSQTIAYREASPGVFEGVLVQLGPKMIGHDKVPYFALLKGLSAGDKIVTAGSFLVDAETRLNPAAGSIYFGAGGGGAKSGSTVTSVRPSTPEDPDAKINASLASLTPADRALAEAQKFCPVLTTSRLGSMGPPVKLTIEGQTAFVCCEACKEQALTKPQETLQRVRKTSKQADDESSDPPARVPSSPTPSVPSAPPSESDQRIQNALGELSSEDRKSAETQRYCVVLTSSRLGSMGKPVKLLLDGKPVFLCCAACRDKAVASAKDAALKAAEFQAVHAELAKLSDADRTLAEQQRYCVVSKENYLGSMGKPDKIIIDGVPVFLCCEGCRSEASADPKKTIAEIDRLRQNSTN